jgi:hypothetical protein
VVRAAVLVLGLVVVGALGGCVFYLNPSCSDQIKNGDETDIDCGGGCGKCEIGDSCKVAVDCEDSDCKGGTCTAFPCFNGQLDVGETDVDCGGSTCRSCAGGQGCLVDRDCASGTCEAGGTCKGYTSIAFDGGEVVPAGMKPYVALTADFDGDHRTDIAACDELGDEIFVFLSPPTGMLQAPATFSLKEAGKFPGGVYPTGGAAVDVNHDGKPDIVTADYHGDAISVLLNLGDGRLGPPASYPTFDKAETSNLAVGDFDDDGNVDVVATNPQVSPSVSVFLGRGDGTFAPAIDLPVGVAGMAEPYSVAVADFNGDHHDDLAIADSRNGSVAVRLGNGDATFQPAIPYAIGGTSPYIIITADLDGDGAADLAVANRKSDNVSVLLGRGDGTFKKPLLASTGPMTAPYSIAADDFNQDGILDLVTGDYASTAGFAGQTASVLIGLGNGKFQPPVIVAGTPAYGVATGDFNGDGKPDFAAVNFTYLTMTVKLNTSR